MRALITALVLVLSVPACASTSDSVLLGQRKVAFVAERDVIAVTGAEGRFTAIQVQVQDSPMVMHGIRITFGNGEKWSPQTRLRFRRGEWTRRIDLPGGARVIRKVEFVYKSKRARSGRATVKLLGIR